MRRQLLLAKKIFLSNFYRQSLPYKLTLILTYRCNFKCKTCNIWRIGQEKEMDPKELGEFFDRNGPFSWVNISGGEIFIKDNIFEMVNIILRKCKGLYLLNFPTNGYFTEKIVRLVRLILKIKNIHLGITVSIDGPPEVNNAIKGDKDAWDKAIQTYRELRGLRNKRLTLKIGYTLSSFNLDRFSSLCSAIKKEIGDFSLREIHLNLAHTSQHYYSNSIKFDRQQKEAAVIEINKKISETGFEFDFLPFLELIYQKFLIRYLLEGKVPFICQALSSTCFIDPYWNVYPCSIYDYKLGNLKDYGYKLSSLWNSETSSIARRCIEQGKCPRCWTPCEAYPTILSNIPQVFKKGMDSKIIIK